MSDRPISGPLKHNLQGRSKWKNIDLTFSPFNYSLMFMEYRDKITANPDIMLGKPVIKGTRITVEFVLEQLSEGASYEELIEDYPGITREDIQACLAYSFDVISRDVLIAG